jgi:hypothetical protein
MERLFHFLKKITVTIVLESRHNTYDIILTGDENMRNKLTIEEIEEIKNNEWVMLSTSKDNIPRAIVVMPSRVESDKIILSNIQMNKSIENIDSNSNCFINVYIKNKNDKQIKISCTAEVYNSGELYNEIKILEETKNLPDELKVHSIIVANIKNIEVSEG